jgi:glycosyltransferase involved in cell wall biosynthesis
MRLRRVLMIGRDFPPTSSSASLRAHKFVRHLSRHGWAASIVCMRPDARGRLDAALLEGLPSPTRVHRAFGFDTKAALSIRDRYPRLLATPDRNVSWFPHGLAAALRACRTEKPDVLLSTSPPVTAHCIGLAVKRRTKLPWVVELRDPWNLDAPPGRLLPRFERWLERQTLAAADRIVVTTEGYARDLSLRLGINGGRIAVVANGYDEESFARLPQPPALPSSFRIVHAGECAPPERDPAPFLRAFRLCLDRGELPADSEVLFLGVAPTTALAEETSRLRLQDNVRSLPRVPHDLALKAMVEASVLLVLQNWDGYRHSVPAKVYEYLRSRACILAVTPPGTATSEVLSGFPGVLQAAPAPPEEIAARLAESHRCWEKARAEGGFARRVESYSSSNLAAKLARLLDELGTGSAGGA